MAALFGPQPASLGKFNTNIDILEHHTYIPASELVQPYGLPQHRPRDRLQDPSPTRALSKYGPYPPFNKTRSTPWTACLKSLILFFRVLIAASTLTSQSTLKFTALRKQG
ncbi:hypothetical protein N7468_000289 [Penicillium chermesinum]|uniref:Uncharacterized protein n=1 Tax=Penicillium chermesinum TaxID=63820 RepID=A0A9W9TY77_9EURO|nr:uncharacterized protein N7468_000289 [Penicillium chermesinum]KAJ5248838.1 hypothetical protein N7468_000289 [Penicillium chermesinum]